MSNEECDVSTSKEDQKANENSLNNVDDISQMSNTFDDDVEESKATEYESPMHSTRSDLSNEAAVKDDESVNNVVTPTSHPLEEDVLFNKISKSPSIENKSFQDVECQTLWSVVEDLKVFGKDLPTPEIEISIDIPDKASTPTEEPEVIIENKAISSEDESVEDIAEDISLIDEMTAPSASSTVPPLREDDDTLPAVGPPAALKYVRESELPNYPPLTPEEIEGGMFKGRCEFCGAPIKPYPSVQDQLTKHSRDNFCCDDYSLFMMFALRRPFGKNYDVNVQKFVTTLIDTSPHAPINRHARKVAKEKAAIRMREREISRQQKYLGQVQQQQQQQQIFQQAAQKALKVIQFSLQSKPCHDEGYIVKPRVREKSIIDVPLDGDIVETARAPKSKSDVSSRNYSNGQLFYVLFPDGSGTVFYDNGKPAIVLSVKSNHITYILFGLDDVIGVISSDGNAGLSHSNGSTRLHYNLLGGCLFDSNGITRKRWHWYEVHDSNNHPPPLHPIPLSLTSSMALRINQQNSVMLTFRSGNSSVKFNTGAKIKPSVKKLILPKIAEPNSEMVYLQEMKLYSQSLIDKMIDANRFRQSSVINRLPPAPYLREQLQKHKISSLPQLNKTHAKKSQKISESNHVFVN